MSGVVASRRAAPEPGSGNKKGVDIVVVREAGDAVTVEVKGVAKKYDWPANNLVTENPDRHFVALVCFEGRIADHEMSPPRVWVVPFPDVEQFKRVYQRRVNVSRAAVLADGKRYENAWHLVEGRTRSAPVPKKLSPQQAGSE